MSLGRSKYWVPLELLQHERAKHKKESTGAMITYQTSKNIGNTLIRTSEEVWSQEVLGKMWAFYIPEHAFNEKTKNKIIEEVQ